MNKHTLAVGQKFGSLTVLSFKKGDRNVICRCVCGQQVTIRRGNLRQKHNDNCGCARRAIAYLNTLSHGLSSFPEYRIWAGMLNRCDNPNSKSYKRYGGRGITVDARWRIFENFFRDMGPRPSPHHSIDRRDNDGPYSPDNCKWATPSEQCLNKNNNHLLVHDGQELPLSAWARRAALNPDTLERRINLLGWSTEKALATPLRKQKERNSRGLTHDGQTMSLRDWARVTGITEDALERRINLLKWPIDKALTTPLRVKRKNYC